MGRLTRSWRMMQAQIERHLMRRLAGAYQPARKHILADGAFLKNKMMGTVSDVCDRLGDLHGTNQVAAPSFNRNSVRTFASSRHDVLAARKSCRHHCSRIFEKLLPRTAGNHAAAIQHQQVAAESESLFHVVGDEEDDAVVAR